MYNKKLSKFIKKLLDDDQDDRAAPRSKGYSDKKRLRIIGVKDEERIKSLQKVLDEEINLRGIDYFRAGLIFQHGRDLQLIRKAKEYAKMSFELGYEPGRWLYAAATDRILMMQRKKQKFGTQFIKNTRSGKWFLHPVQTGTTDSERGRYNVIPLQDIKKVVNKLNRSLNISKIGLTRKHE